MRLLALLVAAAMLAGPVSARADDAASLMAKHRAFTGWAAGDAAMGSWSRTEEQTITHAGKSYVSTGVELRQGLVYRESIQYADGTTRQEGFTGRVFWRTNVNGYTHPIAGDDARALLDDELIFDEALPLIPKASLGGQAVVDGVSTTIVHLEPRNAFPMDVYVDPQSGAFKKIVVDPSGPYEATLTIGAYADAGGGHKVIGTYHWNREAPWKTTAFTQSAVSLDEFHPPQPSATWTFDGPVTVPVEYVTHSFFGNAIVVHATMNGHPGRFLLDSGAAFISVSDQYAREIGARRLGDAAYVGIAGNEKSASTVLVDTVTVGQDFLKHVIAMQGAVPAGLDGILGYDFLAGAIVDVNLDSHTMTIHDPAKFTPSVAPHAYAFPVDLQSLQPAIDISLSPTIKAHPIFDTGDDYFMVLSQKVRDKGISALGDEIDTPYGSVELRPWFGGIDGDTLSSGCVRLVRINVGPYPYEHAPLCFSGSSSFGEDGGLVGFDFLRHFNWTFAYPDNALILTPNGS